MTSPCRNDPAAAPRGLAARSLLAVLLTLALSSPPAPGQTPEGEDLPAAGELRALEQQAEQSFAEDDLKTAIALYRQLADRLEPVAEKVRILTTVAWLQHSLEKDSDAEETLTAALVLDPTWRFRPELYDDRFRDLFYSAQKRAVERRGELAADGVRAGREAMRAGDYTAARRSFGEALRHAPDHPRALYNLALVDLSEGRHDEAVAGFEKVLALGGIENAEVSAPLRSLAFTNLGLLYLQRQRYEEAETVLEQAVELDPARPASWTNLGVARRNLGKTDAAAEAFRLAHELDPEDPSTINNLALVYIDAESWIDAVALLRPAVDRHPDNASLWLNLGLSQLGMDNGEGAAESFEAAIRCDPDDAGGWASAAVIHLVRLHYEAGRHGDAIRQTQRALAWRDGLVNAWIYRGLAQKALGNLADARESFEQARRLDPAQAEVHNNLGSVYYELGLLDEAQAAFEQALAIRGDFASARANLRAVEQARAQPAPPPPPAASPPPPRKTSRRKPPSDKKAPPAPKVRLGLRFADIDYAALGLRGALVESVSPGSAASRAGIRKNDLIVQVDGREVVAADDVLAYLAGRPAGSTVLIDLLRANRPEHVELKLR